MGWKDGRPKKTRQEIQAKYRETHKVQIKESSKEYNILNARKLKNKHLQSRYGVSIEWYDSKLEEQNNLCAACGEPEKAIQNTSGKLRPLSVDHDHESGKTRALLCTSCNAILGMLENHPEKTKKLIIYLRNYGKGHLFD